MWQAALTELFWVIIILGTPVLIAYLWTKYQDDRAWKKEYRYQIKFITYVQDARARQKAKDDHIFNTVREWRNDVA